MEILTVGERIMVYRKRAGLSKKELAERVGVSPATISRYEDDKVENYDADVLINLSVVLNVSINKLLMGIEDPKKRMELELLISQK